jgi:alkyl sulfatase BDS1-like metallo-beta-lactamase superfamily hydrolase
MRTHALLLPLLSATAVWPQAMPENPTALVRVGEDQREALKINDSIYQAIGFGNTFLVTTPDGNVIIDTSMPQVARRHQRLLKAVNGGPIKYIILTHGHGDHTGGVPLWKEAGTHVIAQRNHVEFLNYQKRLENFFAIRNAAQFVLPIPRAPQWAGNNGAAILADILFDDKYEFTLGGVKFEIYRTPGETPDHLTVWIPQFKAAFTGDNYYESFPNIYTLRGTEPRWPLEYISSLKQVLALKPEIVLPSHGMPVRGNAEITRRLTQYCDAIQYVHDEVVKGMNAGKDVYTLMNEIHLPPELNVGESYGKLTWSVRGIYENYAGWFDMNPATMYATPVSAVYGDMVRLAGGPAAVVALAVERVHGGKQVEALHLTDMVLAQDASNQAALKARVAALEALRDACRNTNELGWLLFSIRETKQKLTP